MPEWQTYSLADFLMFAPRTYWRLVELYNAGVWPAQAAVVAVGCAVLVLAARGGNTSARIVPALLAAAWAWVAWGWLHSRFATINWPADYAAAAFAVEAALLAAFALRRGGLQDAARPVAVQLNMWPDVGVAGHETYGTAYSFALYFWDRYGDAGVQALAAEPANGLTGIQNVLNQIDSGKPVDELISDWMVARLLDDPRLDNGHYGYRQTDRAKVQPRQTISRYRFSESARIHQYAADYNEFTGGRDLTLDFAGSTKAQMIDAQPHSGQYFMWSNRGDMADLQLTRDFDLTSVTDAKEKIKLKL